MKKITGALAIIAFVVLFYSCATSREAQNIKKSIDGNWVLQTITAEGITGKIKAQVLNEADFNCFVGSAWKFNSNNSLGSYTINSNGGECAAIQRNIRWSVFEEGTAPKMLQYKRVDSKYKDMDEGAAGFRFTIVNVSKSSMQLRNDITFENKPASFIYNFVKN